MKVFADLDEFFEPGLELVIGGRTYRVEPPDAELGLWLERMLVAGVAARSATTDEQVEEQARRLGKPPGDEDMSLQQRMLGAAYGRMVADGVPWPKIKIAGTTAFIAFTVGEDEAAAYWTSGGRPGKPQPANRAERRRASTGTAAETKTPRRASTSGTSSRKSSSRARASGSAGTTS